MKKRYIFLIILSCLLVFSIFKNFLRKTDKIMENPLKDIEQEMEDAPTYVIYGSLITTDGTIDIQKLCEKQIEDFILEEILCVYQGKVYFVYATPYGRSERWVIGSVDLATEEVLAHCELIEPAEDYDVRAFAKDYKEKNGFFYEGKVVLNDHQKVMVYDLVRDEAKIVTNGAYEFPITEVYGEYVNQNTIRVFHGSSSNEYTLEDMAERSRGIEKLCALQEKKTWSNLSYLDWFLSEYSVQMVNGKLYVVGQCYNAKGYAHMVVLQYDDEKDCWLYGGSHRSAAGDIVHGRCYVIPTI